MSQTWWRSRAARATTSVVRYFQPEYLSGGGCLRPEVLEVAEALGIRPYWGTNNRDIDSTTVKGAKRRVFRTPTFVALEGEEPVIEMPSAKKLR